MRGFSKNLAQTLHQKSRKDPSDDTALVYWIGFQGELRSHQCKWVSLFGHLLFFFILLQIEGKMRNVSYKGAKTLTEILRLKSRVPNCEDKVKISSQFGTRHK